MSFQISPLNFDILSIQNENAIARSIRNLVLTVPGERFFDENLGSEVSASLFENVDDLSASTIRDKITNTIQKYEPRVRLINVNVSPNYETNEMNATIQYRIVGVDALPQQLSFALQPTR